MDKNTPIIIGSKGSEEIDQESATQRYMMKLSLFL